MATEKILQRLQQALLKPEPLWQEESQKGISLQPFLTGTVLPVIVTVAVVSAILLKIFGYHLPMIGVVRPSLTDLLLQVVGTVVMYTLTLVVLGWIAAYLAGMMGGKNDINRAVTMLFWISVPSMLGQILGTLPFVGWVLSLGLGVYSLVLLYRAIPIFLGVPIEDRVKYFIFFLIASFVVSIVLGMTLGRVFTPRDMMQNIRPDIVLPQGMERVDKTVSGNIPSSGKKEVENPVDTYVETMAKGDYNKDVITDASDDTFTPPADGKLTKEQVEKFIFFAKKVKQVEKEQAEKLKEKYEKKEKSENFSISDIFNGLKDFSSLATLEMKVVKENGGNWAEYQWVKDQIREAYYTPSLSPTTQYNAKLLHGHEDILKEVL
jgi:hypothetical protein